MKIVLGIDPGLAATGYGIIQCDGNRYRHLTHGTIRTSAGEEMGARLLALHDAIDSVLERYRPTEAGVENVYFSKNSTSAIPVAQARGVILFALASRGVPFSEYSPAQLKQAVVGRGKAEKHQIQEMVRMVLNLQEVPSPHHAADALAVAFCHASVSGFRGRLAAARDGRV
jgi:crossover junction endodeoxyribonuclease RuvC